MKLTIELSHEGWEIVIATMTAARDAEIVGHVDDIIDEIDAQLVGVPRCDVCDVHTEEADDWCGDCGNCGEHCADEEGCKK
jgi:hypothetical protein